MTLRTIDQRWDAIVVGAGVAGGTLAALLARLGWKVLLVERAAFPREKACGCCLSPATVSLLESLDFAEAMREAAPLTEAQLIVRGHRHHLPHGGLAIPRAKLDQALAQLAQREGASFLAAAVASDAGLLPDARQVRLRCAGEQRTLQAGCVFLADGLGGPFATAIPELRWQVATPSRIGIAAVVPGDRVACPPHQVLLMVGRGGYLGLVRFEDGTVDVAAAADPSALRDAGGPGAFVSHLLSQNGIEHNLGEVVWRGTPLLTRRRSALGAQRLLLVGDACAYVEPFSGEGMKWAVLSSAALAAMLGAPAAWNEHLPALWGRRHRRLLAGQMWRCEIAARLLRHPLWLHAGLSLSGPLARQIVRRVHRPPPQSAYCPAGVST